MSAPEKPDTAAGWRNVEKLLAEKEDAAEKKWLETASDEEIERRMDEAGVKVSRAPSPEELIARAKERAARGADAGSNRGADDASGAKVKALPRRQNVARWATGLALAAGAAVVIARQFGPGDSTHPPPPERATRLRDDAFAECAAKRWTTCESKLDEAKALDADGERDPRVIEARKAIAAARSGGRP
jgi:hypothetical protein